MAPEAARAELDIRQRIVERSQAAYPKRLLGRNPPADAHVVDVTRYATSVMHDAVLHGDVSDRNVPAEGGVMGVARTNQRRLMLSFSGSRKSAQHMDAAFRAHLPEDSPHRFESVGLDLDLATSPAGSGRAGKKGKKPCAARRWREGIGNGAGLESTLEVTVPFPNDPGHSMMEEQERLPFGNPMHSCPTCRADFKYRPLHGAAARAAAAATASISPAAAAAGPASASSSSTAASGSQASQGVAGSVAPAAATATHVASSSTSAPASASRSGTPAAAAAATAAALSSSSSGSLSSAGGSSHSASAGPAAVAAAVPAAASSSPASGSQAATRASVRPSAAAPAAAPCSGDAASDGGWQTQRRRRKGQ